MRTQDLNRYETLARRLSRGEPLDPREVEDVLRATGTTRADLEARAEFHRGWRQVAPPPSKLEAYQEEAKVFGTQEGMFIIVAPQVLLLATLLLLVALIAYVSYG